jgi:hypothetical protein
MHPELLAMMDQAAGEMPLKHFAAWALNVDESEVNSRLAKANR